MTGNEVLKIFRDKGALLNGHFRLSSGLHSDTYLQCALLLQHTELAASLCAELAGFFKNAEVDVVISPAIGGSVVGQEVGRHLKSRAIFCEKEEGKLKLRRGFSIRKGERVLVVEDVVTTGGSIRKVGDIAIECGGEIAGYGCIVDRTGGAADTQLKSLIKVNASVYGPLACPMCKEGVEICRPGSK